MPKVRIRCNIPLSIVAIFCPEIRLKHFFLYFQGPRWVSWNLGIFVCIRCAGIHRNLGVHISKVKSVNLDSWTPHQVAVSHNLPEIVMLARS